MASKSALRAHITDLDELLFRVSRQDRTAFSLLYEATSPKLMSILFSILRDRELANDALQDVYVAIWRRACDFNPKKGAPLAWMSVITRNTAIDLLRKRKICHQSDDQLGDLPSNERSAFQAVNDANAKSVIVERLQRLPEKQRRAVTLFYLEDQSVASTAETLGAPVNTTKSWIRRGLQKLQSDLSNLALTDLVA